MRGTVHKLAVVAAALLAIAGCRQQAAFAPPPRANDKIEVPVQNSVIAVPVTADLTALTRQLEREVPRTLARINRKGETCVAPKRLKVAFVKLKTPRLKCDIVGTVTRGAMRFDGRGQDFVITLPVRATVEARDIGGILKRETATAAANVRIVARLSLNRDWSPTGKVDIRYTWSDEPHVDFLGQRIEFTEAADKELRGAISSLERSLPRELAKLGLRREIEQLWSKAFTSLELNRANPPVWMRITPKELQYGGYSLSGRTATFRLGLKAQTETFVGDRPPNPPTTPLPQLSPLDAAPGKLLFYIPVIADYAQLEPVVQRALVRRSERPFEVPGLGPIRAEFGAVDVYGTEGGRVAVGVTFRATQLEGSLGEAQGQVWLTGIPVNAENSRKIAFDGVQITGDTDRPGADLLLSMANSPGFAQTIGAALAQNFERDYDELMVKITRAIASKREGDLMIRATIDDVRTGRLKAAGQGLYLPVEGTGNAAITLSPR